MAPVSVSVLVLASVRVAKTRISTGGPLACATLASMTGVVPVHDPVVKVCEVELYVALQSVVAPDGGV